MRQDVKILSTYNLMDYSLLLGIQDNPDYVSVLKEMRDSTMHTSVRRDSHSSRNSSIGPNSIEMITLKERFQGNRHKFLSRCGRYIYHIGIIDYL